ncbi:hypothetical protein DACRYDRAFT_97931 [Dacryopinax primogenitus]|uniref:Protein kinase domain-containing protein n=1 Tax=Dacryopinax primogenitus (strain DJM 731) TaxID=1858805 RepID=M5GH29_DACPD|nr:uncharacterized protein DACRYDRAFT_97931 [Dacryopinax primogenitus]EJU06518.1 hypothetical protein DACRYDRAFT_97931 [Dacryopinax primogenitus]
MVPWLLRQLDVLMEDKKFPAPDPNGNAYKAMQEWKEGTTMALHYLSNGRQRLLRAIIAVTKDIVEQYPKHCPDTSDESGKSSLVRVHERTNDPYSRYMRWSGDDILQPDNVDLKTSTGVQFHSTRLLQLPREMAEYHLPRIVNACKEQKTYQMGVSSSPSDIMRLVQRPAQQQFPYPEAHRDHHQLPANVSVSAPDGELKIPEDMDMSLDILDTVPEARTIIIAFARPGATSSYEHYKLSRTDGGPKKILSAAENERDTSKHSSPVVLAAHLKIGEGTCGYVYMAQHGLHRIAAKVSMPEQDERESLVNEYETYMRLRRAGLEGKVAPRCFGLFEGETMTVLLTAYSGSAVKDFDQLSIEDRLSVFRAAKAIEDIGIRQGSFSSRNVVCDDKNVFRVIDFHRGTWEKGRKPTLKDLYTIYFYTEAVKPSWCDVLELEWRHVVPLPETDDSDLSEESATGN